ncbi:V-type ATP synthase subunit A [Acetomicrobium sp. S15 = DSM 107314]|uniref:V-type ATP synthase subunit A n=1 Tax=Acetomicrobium sp. S15 = DSM 107314 TaxID=2529858 RepID=UPI0018E1D664|nr:V-type ATP synthase subunit A [Acetomicrobium sp. S15 = DSM 107314]
MEKEGIISLINGPVVVAKSASSFAMGEMAEVGDLRLIGEVIRLSEDRATIQVYEDTQGLKLGEPVRGTGELLSVSLGPGLIGNIFDGIGRPLGAILEREGAFIPRGVKVPQIDPHKEWEVKPLLAVGDVVTPGMPIAEVQETPLVIHKLLTSPEIEGEVSFVVPSGSYRGDAVIAKVRDRCGKEIEIFLSCRWPVKLPRPCREHLPPKEPLVTGQRVIDGLFPIAKGGVAAIPGGFGTGKTITQHQLAKWSEANVVVYIGCGERGNEMTEVLEEFPELQDPRSGRPLMERTILVANTSNMPVAAREASIYTGIAMAEYYRDMGYDVALMADSTSRWAEALREISGRLEEIPAEEGFPAYLPTRLAEFYERAGRVVTLSGDVGSITIIGAVSPPGGDFTEPVTRHTKRFIRCFWALDKSLANARHFPAISWLDSYSEYAKEVEEYFETNVDPRWGELRERMRSILAEDERIQQVVRLVGEDVLPDEERLLTFTAYLVKNGYLQQSAFGPDAYSPPAKGFLILSLILHFYEKTLGLIKQGVPFSLIREGEAVTNLSHLKELSLEEIQSDYSKLTEELDGYLDRVGSERLATRGR